MSEIEGGGQPAMGVKAEDIGPRTVVECVPYASGGTPMKIMMQGCATRYDLSSADKSPMSMRESHCNGCEVGKERLTFLQGKGQAPKRDVVFLPTQKRSVSRTPEQQQKVDEARARGVVERAAAKAEQSAELQTSAKQKEAKREKPMADVICPTCKEKKAWVQKNGICVKCNRHGAPGAKKEKAKPAKKVDVERVERTAKMVLRNAIGASEPGPLAQVIDLHMRIQALEGELAELEEENPDLIKNAKAMLERIAGGR